jgi:hypothetical protein
LHLSLTSLCEDTFTFKINFVNSATKFSEHDVQSHLLEWTKALGLPALAVAVAFASCLSGYLLGRWQVEIAREKIRHDLYDRRFAIYMAFHELLTAFTERPDVEPELRKANAARAHSPFPLDSGLTEYLGGLHTEAFRMNAESKLVQDPSMWSPQERVKRSAQLSQDKLTFANGIPELVSKFACLRLSDLQK